MPKHMRIALKRFGYVVGGLTALVGGLAGWVQLTYRQDYSGTPLPNVVASKDPAVIARGEYVVQALAHCSSCHGPPNSSSQRKLDADSSDLSGGVHFPAAPFGDFYSANLTPDPDTGLGTRSDGEIARAIRYGVDHTGGYAAMMALSVGAMADEDLTAVVSYLRSLPPKKRDSPPDEWSFLAKALSGKFQPHDEPPPAYVPAGDVSVERGRYIANGPAGCYLCHTPRDPMKGFAESGPRFSGDPEGRSDDTDPQYILVAPNLTPGRGGRLSAWTEDQFLQRMRAGAAYRGSDMPWENFAKMTDEDLRSIYRYLKSLPPAEGPEGPSRRLASGS